MSKKRKNKIKVDYGPYDGEEFECYFQKRYEWMLVNNDGDEEKRCGAYHGSMFWEVPQFGKKAWVLVCNIVVDWKKLKAQGYSEEDIFKGCIKFLNKPPKRKKFQRRIKKSLYGNLSYIPVKTLFKEKEGDLILQALIVTDKRRCNQFWGEGIAT
tara:strand:+ start:190 stop:654 length:465 start_codon:yes stop_codon:yes gene_type:complete